MRGSVDVEFLEVCEQRMVALNESRDYRDYCDLSGREFNVAEARFQESADALNKEVQDAVFKVSSLQDLPNGRDVFNFVWSRAEDEVDIGVVGTFVDAYNEFAFLEEILTTSMKIMER